jgi:hypothetical protein
VRRGVVAGYERKKVGGNEIASGNVDLTTDEVQMEGYLFIESVRRSGFICD